MSLPVADIEIEVRDFHDQQTAPKITPDHTITLKTTTLPDVSQGLRGNGDWIHVRNQGAILRIRLTSNDGEKYIPLHVSFARHLIKPTDPDWKVSSVGGKEYPFSSITRNDDVLMFTDRLPRPGTTGASRVYKFTLEHIK